MVRKTATAALVAAGMIFTITNVEGSGAFAQETVPAPAPATMADPGTSEEELLPDFVSQEVVQPLPEEPVVEHTQAPTVSIQAGTLAELVEQTSVDSPLSEELKCLAGAIYFEARGEPLTGQLAVAQVVINRAASSLFPASYCGVVTQRAQFSFVKNGRIPRARTSSAAWNRAQAIARIAHQGLWDSEARDSLYFHANYVRPSWSRRKVATATIDTHIFYK
ncbi:cell wall hydrolase [Qipengyuania sp. MTN3-11]|uniref:cell wall hydrolase n=1 Tax=Qipengyuania sp. MTN3-11 TaxID=3056557 RepID=UPI0036F4052E